MASTRNRNTACNYEQEIKGYQYAVDNTLYVHNAYGEAHNVKNCGHGLNPGRIYSANLSHNNIDIESFLRGIRSTDLTASNTLQNPGVTSYLHPSFKHLDSNDLYVKNSTIIVPLPLQVDNNRPLLR